MKMLLIPVTGDLRDVEVQAGDFQAMAALIGATYIEGVKVAPDWSLAVDEEGLLNGLPANERATRLYHRPRPLLPHGSVIVGDVLLAREGYVDDGLDWIDTDPTDARDFLEAALQEVAS